MRKSTVLIYSVIFSLLSGCSVIIPKASPADAARILNLSTQYSNSKKTLGATRDSRIPLRKGQWAAMLVRSKRDPNEVTLQIIKVANVSGGSVTLETEMYGTGSGTKRTVIQQRIRNFPTAPKLYYHEGEAASMLEKIQVESIKMMDENGQAQEVPNLPIPFGRLGVDLLRTSVSQGEVRLEPCKSTHIKASRCYAVPFSVRVLFISDHGTTYAHSDVPILGFVSSDSERSNSEVIGFGQTGAHILIH